MADISKIQIESGTYDIKDEIARKRLNINSIKDELYQAPLLMFKKYLNGTSGDSMALQGTCVKYDSGKNPEKIYAWGDYGSYCRLYIVTCGNRDNGSGWNYTYTQNVPVTHGSCLSYKDGKILIASNTSTGHYYIYDIANDSYSASTISGIPYRLLGLVWDEDTSTYLACANDNKDMYVLDEEFNIINHYQHDVDWIQDRLTYTMQSYDYKYGYEFRAISTFPAGNFIAIIDTTNGKLLKMSSIMYENAEIESVNVMNGFAICGFSGYNDGYNLIYMEAITECYIGGFEDDNYLKAIQARKMFGGRLLVNYGGSCDNINSTLYYGNSYSNNELIRYCGTGDSANPVKSGLALCSWIKTWSNLLNSFNPIINMQQSTNTDDNGFIFRKNNVRKVFIVGNNQNICYLDIDNVNFDIIDLNVVNGNTRRTNGLINIYDTPVNSRFRGTNTGLSMNMENNNIIGVFDGGLSITNRAFVRRNTIIGLDKITAGTLDAVNNLIFDPTE